MQRLTSINDKLIEAVIANDLKKITDTINQGANINAKSKKGAVHPDWECTALHAAAMKGHTKAVEELLSRGADVNAKDNCGTTPLQQAMGHHPNSDLVNKIIKAGGKIAVDIANEKLIEGVVLNNIHKIKEALDIGANINAKSKKGAVHPDWECTALHAAAMKGHTKAVEELLSRGADVNAKDNCGTTPLQQAMGHHPNSDLVNKIIKAGGKIAVDIANEKLIEGVVLNNTHKIKEALDVGANINAKSKKGAVHPDWECTALHAAAMKGHTKAVEELLSRGADVNAKDNCGTTPLQQAMGHHPNSDLVNKIIKAGGKIAADIANEKLIAGVVANNIHTHLSWKWGSTASIEQEEKLKTQRQTINQTQEDNNEKNDKPTQQPTNTINTIIDATPRIGSTPKGIKSVKIAVDLSKRLNSPQPESASATQKLVCAAVGTITKTATQAGLITVIGITAPEAAPLAIAVAQSGIKAVSNILGDAAQKACHKVANSIPNSTPAKPQITAAKPQITVAKPQAPAAKPPVLIVTRSITASSKTAPVATKSTAAPAKTVPATKQVAVAAPKSVAPSSKTQSKLKQRISPYREQHQSRLFYKNQAKKPQAKLLPAVKKPTTIAAKSVSEKEQSYNSYSNTNIVTTGDGGSVTSSGGAVTSGGWDSCSGNHESNGLGRDSYSVRW